MSGLSRINKSVKRVTMKRGQFTLREMSAIAIVVALLLELAVARHLSYGAASQDDHSGFAENHMLLGSFLGGASQVASGPQLDPPGELEDTNSTDEETESLDAPWEIDIGDYTVKTKRVDTNDDTVAELEVWKGQTMVYQAEGNRFELAGDQESDDGTTSAYFEPGVSVTGNGILDLIVTEYSGGAHCCMTYYIFELGDEFRLIDTIHAEHGTIDFLDMDGEGAPVIKMSDWSYAYVFGSFGSSPSPAVILRYANGHYEIAPDLMQTPTPSAVELQGMADEIKTNYAQMVEADESSGEWEADTGLWQRMLDLIYGGHEDEARRLFDMAWPAEAEGKDEALTNFVESVSGSLYWNAVYGEEEEQGEPASQTSDGPTPESVPPTQSERND
jgi:hypothetical protein